jgi:hypothetical protein
MGAADSKRRLCNCEARQGRAGQGRAGQVRAGQLEGCGDDAPPLPVAATWQHVLRVHEVHGARVHTGAAGGSARHSSVRARTACTVEFGQLVMRCTASLHGCTCGTQFCRCTVRAACPMQQSMPQAASHNGRTAPLASDCLQVLVHSREHTPPLALVRFPQQLDDAHKVDREQRLQSSPHDGVARQGQRRRAGSLTHGSGGPGEERQGSYGGRVG